MSEENMPEENTPEGTGKRIGKEILSFVLYFVIVIAAMLLIIHYVGQRTEVSGSSMENTLSDGDNLIVDKISYRFHDPERYDIIIFPYKYEEDTYYIKRIIGLPGEHVRIDDSGNIYINGKVLKESYGREVIQDPGIARDEITLGEGEYFVLGDNRNNSSDSRDPSVGIIQKKDIIGRAWLQIYPFDEFGFIRHQ
ncbi:MAG: signal peptidase I [Clostridia bacterium]|jgi:signal peptidase I|nr:signal peptidase I [Lachnospiraceae bacterium]MEE0390998.1 signal peptidase I [Lachnospiraceae bacterium]MEE0513131.1 signal peptidase I [Lachnospiraceae bacterium]